MPYSYVEQAQIEKQLELIEASPILGICFLDEYKCLIQLFDDNVDLREVITEYYRGRISQLARSNRAASAVERLLSPSVA